MILESNDTGNVEYLLKDVIFDGRRRQVLFLNDGYFRIAGFEYSRTASNGSSER